MRGTGVDHGLHSRSLTEDDGVRGSRRPVDDESFDLARYFRSVRRHLPMLILSVSLVTLSVVVASLAVPTTYTSTAQIRLSSVLGGADEGGQRRELATLQALVTTTPVLAPPAESLEVPVTELRSWLSTTIGVDANILSIDSTAPESELAQAAAQGVADSLVQVVAQRKQARLSELSEQLARRIGELAALPDAEAAASLQLLQARQSEVEAAAVAADGELELVEPAQVPAQGTGANATRNGLLAFVGATAVAMLVLLRQSRAGVSSSGVALAEDRHGTTPDRATRRLRPVRRSMPIVVSRRTASPRILRRSDVSASARRMSDDRP